MQRFRITISSRSAEAIVDLVREHMELVSDHGARHYEEVGFLVHAVSTNDGIDLLRARGYVVETLSVVGVPQT
jgi:hypothetical protein